MKADYFEMFENGGFRVLHWNFVYDIDRRLAQFLVEHGMADPLELELKATDNITKDKKNVQNTEQRKPTAKKPRAGNRSGKRSGNSKRNQKRA